MPREKKKNQSRLFHFYLEHFHLSTFFLHKAFPCSLQVRALHRKLLRVRMTFTAPLLCHSSCCCQLGQGGEQGTDCTTERQGPKPPTLLLLRVRKRKPGPREASVAARPAGGSVCLHLKKLGATLPYKWQEPTSSTPLPPSKAVPALLQKLLRRADPFFSRGQGSKAAGSKEATTHCNARAPRACSTVKAAKAAQEGNNQE